MHLAYSVFNPKQQPGSAKQRNNLRLLRFTAYQSACNKYSREIAAIQKYMPGWAPAFR
jgi:hypothetical protein